MTADEILRTIRAELTRARDAKQATMNAGNQLDQEGADRDYTEALENLFDCIDRIFP